MSDAKLLYTSKPATIEGSYEELINFVRYTRAIDNITKALDTGDDLPPIKPNTHFLRCLEKQLDDILPGQALSDWLEEKYLKYSQEEKSGWRTPRDLVRTSFGRA